MLGAIVLAIVVAGCTGGAGEDTPAGETRAGSSQTETTQMENTPTRAFAQDFPEVEHFLDNPTIRRLLRRCPVTRPNHSIPPGEEQNPGAERAPYYRNGKLWTVLYGIIHRTPRGEKFVWWRGVRGRLMITGRRLGRPAPALRTRIPEGYGPIGVQASRIIFPTAGCWRVTGIVGSEALSFVTLVVGPSDL